MHYESYRTPIGPLSVTVENGAVAAIAFGAKGGGAHHACPVTERTIYQIAEYLRGTRKTFDLPLAPHGTDFQRRVWHELTHIPYGETRSYGDIAAAIGSPKACRAVGLANNRNPLPIIVPCHRVIGKNGSLTGYAGGLAVKERLLALEQQHKRP